MAALQVAGRKRCAELVKESELMSAAMTQHYLSVRAYHRILKLAHTIAHLAEALQHRPKLTIG